MIWQDILNDLDVGGRSTDISQLGECIRREVLEVYPYTDNGAPTAPAHVDKAMCDAILDLNAAEKSMKKLATIMVDQC